MRTNRVGDASRMVAVVGPPDGRDNRRSLLARPFTQGRNPCQRPAPSRGRRLRVPVVVTEPVFAVNHLQAVAWSVSAQDAHYRRMTPNCPKDRWPDDPEARDWLEANWRAGDRPVRVGLLRSAFSVCGKRQAASEKRKAASGKRKAESGKRKAERVPSRMPWT